MHARRTACSKLRTGLVVLACLLAGSLALASESSDKARKLLDQGNIRGATIELKNALQRDPTDAEARLLLGRLHLISGNGEAAEKEIRTAIDLGVDRSEWRLDLVEALILQNKYDDALRRLDAAGELTGADAARAQVLRGDAALGRGFLDQARDYYEQALAMEPDNQDAGVGLIRVSFKEGETDNAIAATDAFLARFPDNVDALLIRGDSYRAEGKIEKALETFDHIIAVDPSNMMAMFGRSTVLIAQGDGKAARAQLAQIDRIRKNMPLTSYLKGVLDFREKKWDSAAANLDRMLTVAPEHVQTLLLLGIVRYTQGELETADELLSSAVAKVPNNLQATEVLAATRIKMGKAADAVALLEPFADSGDPQLLALLGSAYMLSGDLEKGQEWLSRSVEDAPDVAALRTQLALTLLAGGQTDQAINELQSAVDLGQGVLQADVLLVLAHLKNGQFDEALAASNALEQRQPDSPIPYNLTGLAYLASKDFDRATERFEKALAVDPGFGTAAINLARVDVARNDPDAAQRRYVQLLETDPKNMAAFLGLAALAEQRKDNDALISWLGRAQDANPTDPRPGLLLTRFYISGGNYLKALTIANDLVSRFPENDAVLQMLARAQTLSGQVENAVRTFEQLMHKHPQDAKLRYLAGGAYWKHRDYARAEQAFRDALERNPDLVDARVALASVALDSGDVETALEAAQVLQKQYPDSALGYRIEGTIYATKRNPQDAAKAFEQAFARSETSKTARQLAEALHGSGKTQQAVELLQGWVEKHPEDMDANGMLGLLLQQQGHRKEAIEVYERVLAAVPKRNPLLLNNLAWLYFETGDSRAGAVSEEAYDLAPSRPEIADTRGWILYQKGHKEQGLSILQQAYLAFPSQSEIGYHVAAALSGLGRNEEAILVARKVLRENPDSPFAVQLNELLEQLGG